MPLASPPPFLSIGSAGLIPMVVSVPHAGRFYPGAIDDARVVPLAVLEQIEDRHADLLIEGLLAAGAYAIVATHARAWIDLNRSEADRASSRERGGLGLVPSRLAGRALWRRAPEDREIAARVTEVHQPYHAAIEAALRRTRERYGYALLVDCHSMPPLGPSRGGVRVVIGDRHGISAGNDVASAARAVAGRMGFPAALNAPYAGAYTLERHGRPASGIHAIQVELDRTLYLDRTMREPGPGLSVAQMLLKDIGLAALSAAHSCHDQAIAAE